MRLQPRGEVHVFSRAVEQSSVSAPAPQPSPRRAGLQSMGIGLLMVGISLGAVAIGAAVGWTSVEISGAAFLLGWIVFGFGVGETLFAGKLRIVTMLLALFIGIAGIFASFWVIGQLGFTLRGA